MAVLWKSGVFGTAKRMSSLWSVGQRRGSISEDMRGYETDRYTHTRTRTNTHTHDRTHTHTNEHTHTFSLYLFIYLRLIYPTPPVSPSIYLCLPISVIALLTLTLNTLSRIRIHFVKLLWYCHHTHPGLLRWINLGPRWIDILIYGFCSWLLEIN